MLKNRGRDPRAAMASVPTQQQLTMRHQAQAHPTTRQPTQMPAQRALPSRPEPDYEVVEFPTEQYMNAKLQPPPPPPPRPTAGHPVDAGASCGLCGGGGARVRCAECGRRALCASCDDMYHRHPKRRNHQRQAISALQMRDERPPLPPKVAAPIPPPRRHKISGDRMSASPRPPGQDQRVCTLGHSSIVPGNHNQTSNPSLNNHIASQHALHQTQLHLQAKISPAGASSHLGSMPYLPSTMPHAPAPVAQLQGQSNTLGHLNAAWTRPRGSLQGFNMPLNMVSPHETWQNHDNISPTGQAWTRPLRRGASVLELGGGAPQCVGCAHCAPTPWRYGSCASLDHPWAGGWQPTCCGTPHPPSQMQIHPHSHQHPSQTPQPYRRVESRTVSRAASRAGSRAVSPAVSTRSRVSRRTKHRTPSPPPLPSSDADSESECESDHGPVHKHQETVEEESLGPVPPPPSASWQCEHCTFVNEPGVRVCVVCCRTPTMAPKIIAANTSINMERLKITESPPSRVAIETHHMEQNGGRATTRSKRERTSIACGQSPPRDGIMPTKKPTNRLVTPTREQIGSDRAEQIRRHDMAVGPSPPREEHQNNRAIELSPSREPSKTMKVSPYREIKELSHTESTNRQTVSVGPSPPREITTSHSSHVIPSNKSKSLQKKSTGTSPQRETSDTRSQSRGTVSNTGTSPPPQSISTQTYEVPSTWERAPSAARSRPRRRFRDEGPRERSHSRHSLSSDTRESERSVRTSGPGASSGGRWEWRERDSSPGGEWSEGHSRLSRRASHLDLRRSRPTRRSSYYGSEAASPEPQSATRAISLEALAGAGGKREAERGLELGRLMSEAERLGFSAAEVQAALAQSPAAPLAWLRARWPSLVAGVRAAAARLAPALPITDMDARAALAKHKGAMWPAVTECVDRHRHKPEAMGVGEERRLRGRVWGSPAGADDDAAPPLTSIHRSHRTRAEDSSDEFEEPTQTKFQDDQWMYLPLENENKITYIAEHDLGYWNDNYLPDEIPRDNTEEIAQKLKKLLVQAGVPSIDEKLLLMGLLSDNTVYKNSQESNTLPNKIPSIDLIQSENDFIDAYNALTRTSPLPNINSTNISQNFNEDIPLTSKQETHVLEKMEFENVNDRGVNNQENLTNNNSQLNQNSHTPKNGSDNNLVQQQAKVNHTIEVGTISKLIHNKEKSISEKHTSNNSTENDNIQIKEKSEERESYLQSEEKSKNLNDIVDNTQKLIQQMKEEITSDINSLDGTNISHSEPDTSSNDEQESSYSDTEEGSDNLTSDEKETASTDDDEILHLSRKDTLTNNRTSSEDNEQFEEALDNLDNQIENFKHKNIEILDSIARNLQKEHTITIEISESSQLTKGSTLPHQDLNNNLFVAVNTFEEIYEDLNGTIANKRKNIQPTLQKPVNVSGTIKSDKLHDIKLYEKHAANLSIIKTEWPIKLIFSEYLQPVFQARLENIEESFIDDTIDNKMDNDINVEITDNHNRFELSLTNTSVTDVDTKIESNRIDEIESTRIDKIESNQIDVKSDKSRSLSPLRDRNLQIITQDTNRKISEQELNTNVFSSLQSNIINETENIHLENNVQSNELKTNNKINSTQDKTSGHANNNNSKNPIGVKSNIPKLIKLPQNTKPKTDKNSPKLIVSKVPIRRASIKQYPAPAPPKSHFGNVQSGLVKKLQTRLFNSKSSKASNNIPETDVIKPSTSTPNKKKPAPPPPFEPQGEKNSSPPKQSQLTEKKNNYFRETCRTEDEWTESDSDDSQLQTIKSNEEPIPAPPSPPPPITLRRVSGQLIDLAKVRLPEGSPERQARMLLAEGATETWEQAKLATDLVSRGIETPVALLAALECADLNAALAYLHQDCELCASRFPEHEMVSMLRCTHRCCRECAHHYFTVQITERSIADCVCPYCKVPELENLPEDAWLEYFAHLDILLKTLLETDVHELFQRKLRDRTLARDPNFRWCMECSSGFFVHPKHKKLRCPECRSVSCASCRKPWTTNHEGLSCEQYTVWLEDNDPERSVAAVQQHLRENGLECPRCHFKYSLSRGGCMHFTCTQCKYEFCYGCGKPFMMGARCGLSEYCAKLGLHAHHPRNCLFYLRDKEPHELQTLLQMNNVTYEIEATDGAGRCPLQLQRETPTGLVDGTCGSEAPANYAGLCKNHYLEYLSRVVRRCNIDPLPILGVDDLETLVRRAALRLPPRPYGTLEGLYKRGLFEVCSPPLFLQGPLRGVPGGAGARARPHSYNGRAGARGGAAPPRAAAARARPLGHRPHLCRDVCPDCEGKNSPGLKKLTTGGYE